MLQTESTQTLKLTFEHTALGLSVVDSLLEEIVCVLRDVRDETDARWVDGGVGQVSIIENDRVRLEEWGTKTPAVEGAFAWGVGSDNILSDASCCVTSNVW